MISQYLDAAMEQAHYEIIDDVEPYYGEIPPLQWRVGHRQNAGGMSTQPEGGVGGLDYRSAATRIAYSFHWSLDHQTH